MVASDTLLEATRRENEIRRLKAEIQEYKQCIKQAVIYGGTSTTQEQWGEMFAKTIQKALSIS